MGVVVAGLLAPAGLASASVVPAPDPADASLGPIDPGAHLQQFPLPDTSALPSDIEGDGGSGVWVSTFADKRVLHLSSAGALIATAQLSGAPSSVATDHEGGVWAALYASNRIAHVTAAGAVTEYVAPTPNSFPANVYDHGDYVFFTESNTGKLGRITQSTGAIVDFAIPGAVTPWALDGISLAKPAKDEIWVTDAGADGLWVLDVDGGVLRSSTSVPGLLDIKLGTFSGGAVRYFGAAEHGVFEFSSLLEARLIGSAAEFSSMVITDSTVWVTDTGAHSLNAVTAPFGSVSIPAAYDDLVGTAHSAQGRLVWTVSRASGVVIRVDTISAAFVDRIAGADRFEVSAKAAQRLRFLPGEGVAFLTSGETFADALSVGPIAARLVAPVLLTKRDDLPEAVREELSRREPKDIVVVGGPNSVSQAVIDRAAAAVPSATITRVGGADRFAVSRALLASPWAPAPPATLYIVDGRNYPDALSSGPAAARGKGGVLLVDGSRSALATEELAIVRTLAAAGGSAMIVGGPASVSMPLEASIAAVAPTTRIGGANRYEVSTALNRAVFPEALDIVIASGEVFPDALAGAAMAGHFDQPLYLAHPDCIPAPVLDFVGTKGLASVLLLGGEKTLTPAVAALTACG
jgi:putative cell wall-binding protein